MPLRDCTLEEEPKTNDEVLSMKRTALAEQKSILSEILEPDSIDVSEIKLKWQYQLTFRFSSFDLMLFILAVRKESFTYTTKSLCSTPDSIAPDSIATHHGIIIWFSFLTSAIISYTRAVSPDEVCTIWKPHISA